MSHASRARWTLIAYSLIAVAIYIAVVFIVTTARAQNNWPTPGGSLVDGHVDMCLNGAGVAVPCGTATNPVAVVTGSGLSAVQIAPPASQLAPPTLAPAGPSNIGLGLGRFAQPSSIAPNAFGRTSSPW